MPHPSRHFPAPASRSTPDCVEDRISERIRQLSSGLVERRNVRILIIDLIIAARALHEFRLLAAGSTYATLELTEEQRERLSQARVEWSYD